MNVTSRANVSCNIPVYHWFYSLEYESDFVLWSAKDVEERGTAIAVEWLGRLRKTCWYSASGQRIESGISRIRTRNISHSPLLSLCFAFKFVSYNTWLSAVDSLLGLRVSTCPVAILYFQLRTWKWGAIAFFLSRCDCKAVYRGGDYRKGKDRSVYLRYVIRL